MNYLIVSSQTHIHSSLLCSAQKITEDGKFQRVMKKGINNACRTSKTPRLLLTLAGITNSDFQIIKKVFVFYLSWRLEKLQWTFQEFFVNSNQNSAITRLIKKPKPRIYEFTNSGIYSATTCL